MEEIKHVFEDIKLDAENISKLPLHYSKLEKITNILDGPYPYVKIPFYNSNKVVSLSFYKNVTKIFPFNE